MQGISDFCTGTKYLWILPPFCPLIAPNINDVKVLPLAERLDFSDCAALSVYSRAKILASFETLVKSFDADYYRQLNKAMALYLLLIESLHFDECLLDYV